MIESLANFDVFNIYGRHMNKEKYNGWTNWETWNVTLWLGNDEDLYNLAKMAGTYKKFLKYVDENGTTGDGVNWRDSNINVTEVNKFFEEL